MNLPVLFLSVLLPAGAAATGGSVAAKDPEAGPAATGSAPRAGEGSAHPGTTGAPPRDYDAPPPGSTAQDQALWARARYVNNQILIERGLATRLQTRAKGYRYNERLLALAKAGSIPAAGAEELAERITRKWNEVVELLLKQWPVDPTRACRAPLLVFEGVLYASPSPGKAGQLEDARRILTGCVAKGAVPLELLARLNREMEDLLGQADRVLAGAPAAATSAAAPAAATAPASPASGGR